MRRRIGKNGNARSWYKLKTRLINLKDLVVQWVPSSRRGWGFLWLFYATILGFAFCTFYSSDCVQLPVYENAISNHHSEMNVKTIRRSLSCEEHDNSTHDLILTFLSRGIINPKKIYPTLFGFSCSYPNYIKSTSFKFTDIS